MKLSDKHRVLCELMQHQGHERGIPAKGLAEQAGVAERQLREIVSSLRQDGVAVCGRPESGYFIARTSEELEETCLFLRARAMHSLSLESKLRHVPLPELLGQLRLKT